MATKAKCSMILLHGSTLYAGAGERSKKIIYSAQGADVTCSPKPDDDEQSVQMLLRILVLDTFRLWPLAHSRLSSDKTSDTDIIVSRNISP